MAFDGVFSLSSQYLYEGKGPFDAKMLVETFDDLINADTWTVTVEGVQQIIAYRGMIVSVRKGSDTYPDAQGVYFFHDGKTKKPVTADEIKNVSAWNRLGGNQDVSNLITQLENLSKELSSLGETVSTLEKERVFITRDNEYNYKQKTPILNEICLVDVPGNGVRVKVGDGTTSFADLPYLDKYALDAIDAFVVRGYLYQEVFYLDSEHTTPLEKISGRIYIDIVTSKTYSFNGVSYESTTVAATSSVAGVVKLYDELGNNTDGAITQRAVTEELNQKFEVDFDNTQEMLIFDTDLND